MITGGCVIEVIERPTVHLWITCDQTPREDLLSPAWCLTPSTIQAHRCIESFLALAGCTSDGCTLGPRPHLLPRTRVVQSCREAMMTLHEDWSHIHTRFSAMRCMSTDYTKAAAIGPMDAAVTPTVRHQWLKRHDGIRGSDGTSSTHYTALAHERADTCLADPRRGGLRGSPHPPALQHKGWHFSIVH